MLFGESLKDAYFASLYGKEVSHTHYPGASLSLFKFPEHAAKCASATITGPEHSGGRSHMP